MSIDAHLRNIDVIADEAELDRLKSQSAAMGNLIRGQLKLVMYRDGEGARKELEEALRSRGDWKEARFQYSLALAIDAERLLEGPNGEGAIDLLKRAIDYAPDHAPHYVQLALAYEKLGRPAMAGEFYRKANVLLEATGAPPIPLAQLKLTKNPN